MQTVKLMKLVAMIITLSLCIALEKADAAEREAKELLKIFNDNFVSKDGKLIVFRHDEINTFSDDEWEKIHTNQENILNKDNIVGIYLLGGEIPEQAMKFFSMFDKVKSLVIGEAIDGAHASKEALAQVGRFKNLENLTISIHEIDMSSLSAITQLDHLRSVAIYFPRNHKEMDNHKESEDK